MPNAIDKRIPSVNDNITTRFLGDEAFIMNLATVATFSLNETASEVWSLIDGVRTVDIIVDTVRDTYDVPVEQCRTAVTGIIDRFHAQGLVNFSDTHD